MQNSSIGQHGTFIKIYPINKEIIHFNICELLFFSPKKPYLLSLETLKTVPSFMISLFSGLNGVN